LEVVRTTEENGHEKTLISQEMESTLSRLLIPYKRIEVDIVLNGNFLGLKYF